MSVDGSHAVAASDRTRCGATWKSRSSLHVTGLLLTAQPSTTNLFESLIMHARGEMSLANKLSLIEMMETLTDPT